MGKRMLNIEILQRVKQAEDIIYDWMLNSKKAITEPETFFEVLVKCGLYKYDSKGRAHYFREDLRTLRDNNKLDIFTKINVIQNAPGRPWIINVK
jgi:hypothetical protein